MNLDALPGAPFDLILDVGGNIGETAERMHERWPEARLVSFEPIPGAADANRERANGRWEVVTTAIGERHGRELLWFCTNQHTASTMLAPGTARKRHFGVDDVHEMGEVEVQPLDAFTELAHFRCGRCGRPPSEHTAESGGCPDFRGAWTPPRILIKIDVEGYEGHVLKGARRYLDCATTVVCEIQQDPTIFFGSPRPLDVDRRMNAAGLWFAGLADAFLSPGGDVLQWDGVWTRDVTPWLASASEHKQT